MLSMRTAVLQTMATLWRRFVPRPGDLSLRTRLRLFVLMLMFSVVTALSLLHLYTLGKFGFEDVLQRAQNTSHEVQSFVQQRVREMVYDLPPERRTEAHRTLYASLLAADEEVPVFLRDIGSNSRAIVEISISDASGRILADDPLPSRVGQKVAHLPNFEAWAKKSPWQKLSEVFSERRDYQVVLDIREQGQTTPVFSIEVVLSSILLREIVLPQVRSIALIFLGALLLSLLLAVVVSNLVLRPLDNIGQAIDRISRGELANASWVPEGSAKEFAAVQSKLNLLGQQYRGARQDAIQLRSNVEQLLERLEEVVLLFDRDDRLVMAGRAAESILGRGRWEIMGRTLTDLFPPSTALGAALRNAIELRQPLKDVPLALESGPGTRVLASAEVLESFPDRQRIGTLITLRDAETRRQIRSQLDVSARLAAISRLTGGVAHEIKNPLQAITVHMEVLKSKLADQYDNVGVEIETIAREILRLDRVVKTFLDFTRPVDLKMRDIGMVTLVQDVAGLVGPSAGRQNVHIEVDSDPEEIYVHGDPDLLQQAILNVVANGVEAMKNGGLLRIQLTREGDECCVSISDEGAGIPLEIREQIFHLYFTTKGKGSGIGLAVTFRVVQLHNGTIDFTSESGRGATFRLRIPAIYKEEFGRAQSIGKEGTTGD